MSVGTRLKKARNKLGLSIEDIRDKSKIKKNYLVAIENDNFEKLPGEVYTKVYIRGYAKIVGLDPQEILAEYKNDKRKNNGEVIESNDSSSKKARSRNNNKDKNKKITKVDKIFKGIIGVILILIIVLLSYNIFFRPDQNQNDTAINDQNTEVVQQQDDTNSTNNNEIQSEENQVGNDENNNIDNNDNSNITDENTTVNQNQSENSSTNTNEAQSIVEDTSKEFKIIANDKSWLQITIDDDLKYQGFINEDEIMTHSGEDTVTLKIGNGIAVQVEINGEVLGPFGKRGEVIIKQFDLN